MLILLLTGFLVPLSSLCANNQIEKVKGQQAEPTIFEADVPVRGTYLCTFEWWPYWGPGQYEWDDDLDMYVGVSTVYHIEKPLIVDLQANGFAEGDMLLINYRGQVYFSGAWNPSNPWTEWDINGFWLIGVFSSTSDLKPTRELNRVPGAIDAGEDHSTPTTYWKEELETLLTTLENKGVDISNLQRGSVPTDIPQDFLITPRNGMWIKVPKDAKYLFICIEDRFYSDTIGSAKVKIEKDTDRDGLADSWETKGIDADMDDNIDLKLEGADYMHKDIYVEVDWLPGHRPSDEAMNDVKKAFNEADIYNPDLTSGVNLHIEMDEGIMPSGGIGSDVINMWEHFDLSKKANFGTVSQRDNTDTLEAKKQAYHYCLFVHQFALWNATSGRFEPSLATGLSERPGNDFVVATGVLSVHGGTRGQQAAIFMHELGHNLGIRHGGQDNINYKPNYLSVMNYMYMFNFEPIPNRPLDFSREKLKTLDESNLNETDGLGVDYVPSYAANWRFTVRPISLSYIPYYGEQVDSFRNIDWSQTGIPHDIGVQANINNFPQWKYESPPGEKLESYVDWTHLDYYFQQSPYFPDDTHGSDPGMYEEITADVIELMHQAALRIHDIAITNVATSATLVGQKNALTVNVTLENMGGNDETFNVTVYANTTSIESTTLTLSSGNTTTISLTCNTAGLRVGNYTLTSYVKPLANETYTADNTIIGGIITVFDETPPTVTISSPVSGSEVQASTVTVTWTGSDVNSGVAGYEVRLDGGSWTNVGTGTSREFTGLNDGNHTVEVRAADLQGNTKTATVNFTISTSSWLLPLAAVVSVVAVIVVAVLFFWRRRAGKSLSD